MWQAPLVGVEAVGIQKRLSESTQLQLDALASRGVSGYRLKVIPIVYSKIYKGVNAKPERIKRIAWRFEGGHIKLPYDLAHRAGTDFFELHTQIQNFTPDMKLLPHDDAIDTLAMGGFCPRPRGTYEARVETQDPMRLIEEGKLYFPGTRMPLAMAVSTQELSPKAMEVLEERAMRGPKKVRGAYRPRRGRRSRLARRRGIQVRRRVGV